MNKQLILFEDLGKMDYQRAWDYQESLLQENVLRKRAVSDWQLAFSKENSFVNKESDEPATTINDKPSIAVGLPKAIKTINHLLFVEHPPVYTLGKSGKEEHVLINEDERKENISNT